MRPALIVLGVWFAACSLAQAGPASARPDVLLIMPDQMRGDCLSAVGHPVVRTPHLDALAAEGVMFRRAYTTIPSCIPARHALLTSRFPQTSGVVGFQARPITCPTLPQVMRDAGYATVLVGREMHQARGEPYGYQRLIRGSTYVNDDDYDTYLKQVAPETGGIHKLVGSLRISYNGWRAQPWPQPDDRHPTAWVVDQARKVVAEMPAGQPLFLTASFYAPHPPLFPPKQYFDAYLAKNLPQPAHGSWVDWKALTTEGDKQGHRVLLEGDTLRRSQAGYFGLIEHLDEQILPLVEAFKARAVQAGRPWLIVVTTDHGEMLGDHGFFRKCEPYEGSANIPLIVAGSAGLALRPGLRSKEPVCLEDVMPTLLELSGIASPPGIDGISLVPVLRGQQGRLREWLHLEHAPCYSKAQAFHALVDGRYKYIWRPTEGEEQLFDLDQDPREERDLAQDASQQDLLKRWRTTLIARLAGRPEGFSDGTRLIPGRLYPGLQKEPKAAK